MSRVGGGPCHGGVGGELVLVTGELVLVAGGWSFIARRCAGGGVAGGLGKSGPAAALPFNGNCHSMCLPLPSCLPVPFPLLHTSLPLRNLKSQIILCFIDCYKHLLIAISHLQKKNICHFDIKSHNIIFNTKKNIPILIDFGLSIDIEQINELLKFFFYRYVPE